MIYERQTDIYPAGTNAFQKSFSHIFHVGPLSLKLPEMAQLVKGPPGNACSHISHINSLTYGDWTNCSNLLEEGNFFKVIYASHPLVFFNTKGCFLVKGVFLLLQGVVENPCL